MTPKFEKSNNKHKKYSVITPSGKKIHFGDKRYEQFRDTTGLGLYTKLNHNDKQRQANYCKRAKGIKNKKGQLTYKDKETPNYYSVKYLWNC